MRTIKFLGKALLALLILIAIYLLAAYTLMYIPVNSNFKQCEKDSVHIYLKSNGVHTDLALPFKNELKDWSVLVSPANTKAGDPNVKYASFGWGDRNFYIETPTWADLKFKTAFKALFFMGRSALHVAFLDKITENSTCRKICISKNSYSKLVTYIENSFQINNGKSIVIPGASYWDNDSFYEAKGTFNLFFTCNTWTNSGLKAAGLKACLWTPFDKGIMYHYTP